MGRLDSVYDRLHDAVTGRPIRSLLGTVLLAALLALGLTSVRLDMSFRPLFVDRAPLQEATEEFEEIFGQESGAFVGVILERPEPDLLTPDFLARLAGFSDDVARLEHVSEVVSLARLVLPSWTAAGPRGEYLAEPEALARGDPRAVRRIRAAVERDHPALPGLLSEDHRKTLLLARVDLPLEDLRRRTQVVARLRELTEASVDPTTTTRFVGVSVVEAAYARIVLTSLARSFALTVLALLVVLILLFRTPTTVLVTMAGVSLATPAALGLMTLMGQDLTMLNSVVPVMILIIGVADSIHMQHAFEDHIRRGRDKAESIRAMYREMALPCLLTTATTSLGFLSLTVARIGAIGDFGLSVGVSVWVVYGFNLVLVPALLTLLPVDHARVRRRRDRIGRRMGGLAAWTVRRRAEVMSVFALAALVAALGLPRLDASQRFNEEVSPDHPVRADQTVLEREFAGFLGPEISIRRRDGGPLTDEDSWDALRTFRATVAQLPVVHSVDSPIELVPPGLVGARAAEALGHLREDPLLGTRARALVDASMTRGAVIVRTGDLGTDGAIRLVNRIEIVESLHLAPSIEAEVVGQWWLAQSGMHNIIRDLTATLLTSCVIVLAVLWLAFRKVEIFLVSVLPNVLPMFFALAFMAWSGISLRIGTATVLAIALGIAVDDTIHLMVRLREERRRGREPEAAIREALQGVGGALFYTTVVLGLGFLTMLWNDLYAIRDMGLVGAFALTTAFVADVLLVPALTTLMARAPTASGRAKPS